MTETSENGWVKLYSPRGPQVTLPVTTEPLDYAQMLANVHAMLDAGWLVAAPGLEEGEQKEEIGWVLRGKHENKKTGEITPTVLLYANSYQLTWSILKVYLNRPVDVAAFEYASRLTLAKMPLYIGKDKPQRGASKDTDEFIVRAPKPFTAIYKANPKHNDSEEGKMEPARLLVRWQDQAPPQKPEANGKPPNSEHVSLWTTWLQKYIAVDDFNQHLSELSELDAATKRVVWGLIQEHAAQRHWAFDKELRRFVAAHQEEEIPI